jgi:hypothetical protein
VLIELSASATYVGEVAPFVYIDQSTSEKLESGVVLSQFGSVFGSVAIPTVMVNASVVAE